MTPSRPFALSLVVAALAAVCFAAPAPAIEGEPPQIVVTWIGGEGSWDDPANWSPSVVPNNTETETYAVEILAAGAKVLTRDEDNISGRKELAIDQLTVGENVELHIEDTHLTLSKSGILLNNGKIDSNDSIFVFVNNIELQGNGEFNIYDNSEIYLDESNLINGASHKLNLYSCSWLDLNSQTALLNNFINNGDINIYFIYFGVNFINNGLIIVNGTLEEDLGFFMDSSNLINNNKIEVRNNGKIGTAPFNNEHASCIIGGEISTNGDNIILSGNFKDVLFTGNAQVRSYDTSNYSSFSGNCVFNCHWNMFLHSIYLDEGFVLKGNGSLENLSLCVIGEASLNPDLHVKNVRINTECFNGGGLFTNNGTINNLFSSNSDLTNNGVLHINEQMLGSHHYFYNINNENGIINIDLTQSDENETYFEKIESGILNINGEIHHLRGKLKQVELSGNPTILNAELVVEDYIINNGKITSEITGIAILGETFSMKGNGEWISSEGLTIIDALHPGSVNNDIIFINESTHVFTNTKFHDFESYVIFINMGKIQFNNLVDNLNNSGILLYSDFINEGIFISHSVNISCEYYTQIKGSTILINEINEHGGIYGGELNLQGVNLIQHINCRANINNTGGVISPELNGMMGELHFIGHNFSQSGAGALNMDILLGPEGNLQADKLQGTPDHNQDESHASLGGTLNVHIDELAGSTEPIALKLLEFNAIEGAFDQVNIIDESPYIDIEITQTATEVLAIVTPTGAAPLSGWVAR